MPSIKDYDYYLPKELIAQSPAEPRDSSRLLVYHKPTGCIEHRIFRDILDYLRSGDVLVANESRVVKTRLTGRKGSGGRVSITLVDVVDEKKHEYDVFVKGKNPKIGTLLYFSGGLVGEIVDKNETRFVIKFNKDPLPVIERYGDYTLPGYIHNERYDRDRYQTVFANPVRSGSIAAPTAGLHFTQDLLDKLREKGIIFTTTCLHVGIGTFQEVEVDDYTKHKMHSEWVEVDEETANIINNRKGRLFVVGTTSLRALETATDESGMVRPYRGYTDLFIYPGYRFKLSLDGMITNFHLPRSTLLLLVSAIIGDDWKRVYRTAVEKRYRFFSFGDAMLILLNENSHPQ